MPRIVRTVHACKYGTSTVHIRARAWRHGVFIRELHPLLPGEQLVLGEIKFGKIFVPIQLKYEH